MSPVLTAVIISGAPVDKDYWLLMAWVYMPHNLNCTVYFIYLCILQCPIMSVTDPWENGNIKEVIILNALNFIL